ncbi:glycosyl hydrolase family 65 protein [Streptomyces hirsutus]
MLRVRQERLVHMAHPHLAALRTEFTAEGYSGALEVEAALDGGVTNAGVARYRDLDGRHLTHVHSGSAAPDTVWLHCRTRTSDIRIALASRLFSEAPVTFRKENRRAVQLTPAAPDRGPYGDRGQERRAVHRRATRPSATPCTVVVDGWGVSSGSRIGLEARRTACGELRRRGVLDVRRTGAQLCAARVPDGCSRHGPAHRRRWMAAVPARGLHGEAYLAGRILWVFGEGS